MHTHTHYVLALNPSLGVCAYTHTHTHTPAQPPSTRSEAFHLLEFFPYLIWSTEVLASSFMVLKGQDCAPEPDWNRVYTSQSDSEHAHWEVGGITLLSLWSEVKSPSHVRLFATPSMDCSLTGSSIHGIFQARILEWVAISFSRGSSRPRDWTQVSRTVGSRFTVWVTREVQEASKLRTLLFGFWLYFWAPFQEKKTNPNLIPVDNHHYFLGVYSLRPCGFLFFGWSKCVLFLYLIDHECLFQILICSIF